jgi:Sodium/hydrogen exchanger family
MFDMRYSEKQHDDNTSKFSNLIHCNNESGRSGRIRRRWMLCFDERQQYIDRIVCIVTVSVLLFSLVFTSEVSSFQYQRCGISFTKIQQLQRRQFSVAQCYTFTDRLQRLQCRHRPSESFIGRKTPTIIISTKLNLFPVETVHAAATTAAAMTAVVDYQSISSFLGNQLSLMFQMPFAELGKELSQSLDIGNTLSREIGLVPETTTTTVLNSLGYDLLVFLAASVVVTPIAKVIGVTPILGYLIIGAILGPHGFDVFANSHADIELGDIGIMFLLFSEGLEVSTARLQKLANFLPLGLAQISLVTGTITAAFLFGLPQFFDYFLPLDSALINIDTPIMAFILAFAGALSTSAFIFPVLKERGWEEDESGEAATSILLLQDLLVAPFLVLLPYLVGESETDYTAIGFLTGKAIVGFGAVMYLASLVLRRVFNLVARTQSTETFVALCLLVAAGMGAAAKQFGLTDTAGAFAAGMVRIWSCFLIIITKMFSI